MVATVLNLHLNKNLISGFGKGSRIPAPCPSLQKTQNSFGAARKPLNIVNYSINSENTSKICGPQGVKTFFVVAEQEKRRISLGKFNRSKSALLAL